MPRITVNIDDAEIQLALARLTAAVTDLSPVMADVAEFWLLATKNRMVQGVTPEGAPFAPRAQSTLDAYAARKPPAVPVGGPLRLSDVMRQQLAHGHGTDFAEIASNAIQAAVMQFGAAKGAFGQDAMGRSIPWGDIPARPFLGLSESDRTGIIEIVAEWLEGQATGA